VLGAFEIRALFGNRLLARAPTITRQAWHPPAHRDRLHLLANPKLLMLDEPTPGMRPAETLELAAQINSLNRQRLTN